MTGTTETALFVHMAERFAKKLATATGGGLSSAEVRSLFERAYREGRNGVAANDPKLALKRVAGLPRGELAPEPS